MRAASHVKVLSGAGASLKYGTDTDDTLVSGTLAEDKRETDEQEESSAVRMLSPDGESDSLGMLLRTLRERRGMSIDELAREAHIAAPYVRALEEEEYRVFPALVYAEGFFKRVAQLLMPDAIDECMAVLREHWDQEMDGEGSTVTTPPARTPRKIFFTLTPRRMMFGIAGIFFAVIVGFLVLRLISFLSPPRISLESPREEVILSVPRVRVKGHVNQEGHLTVNNREVRIDESGNFNEEIEVGAGTNTLAFVAENKFGRRAKVVRHIVVR